MGHRLRKLNCLDSIDHKYAKKYNFGLRRDLHEWIKENSTGSFNSVVNFLVNVGINQVDKILQHDSLYVKVRDADNLGDDHE